MKFLGNLSNMFLAVCAYGFVPLCTVCCVWVALDIRQERAAAWAVADVAPACSTNQAVALTTYMRHRHGTPGAFVEVTDGHGDALARTVAQWGCRPTLPPPPCKQGGPT